MRKCFRKLIRTPHSTLVAALFCLGIFLPQQVTAQDLGSLTPRIMPLLAHPDNLMLPAKQLFGRETTPTLTLSEPIGFYAHGCLAGGVALPLTGPDWQ